MNEDTRKYLEVVWGDKPEGTWYHLFTLPAKKSIWVNGHVPSDLDRASGQNIYVCLSLTEKKLQETYRISHDIVCGFVGLSVDIDFSMPGHHSDKHKLPDLETALKIVNSTPFPPTIIINSGGGLYGQWLFREPWMFDNEEDKDRGLLLSKKWNYFIRKQASDMGGYHVDLTFDLPHLYRLPGTVNRKTVPGKPVKIISITESRYTPDELFDAVDHIEILEPTIRSKNVQSNFILNQNATPNQEKLEALMQNDSRFCDTWQHRRRDGVFSQKQDTSTYDMALATMFLRVGWTDQEIVDALVYHRQQNETPGSYHYKKSGRADYYEATLRKAKSGQKDDDLLQELEHKSSLRRSDKIEGKEQVDSELPIDKRLDLLTKISELIKVPISRVFKLSTEEPEFFIETMGHEIKMGPSKTFIEQSSFRQKIAAHTHVLIERRKANQWDSIAQSLLDVCEIVDVGEEGGDVGTVKSLLRNYIEQTSTCFKDDEHEQNQNLLQQEPVIRDGTIIFHIDQFRRYIRAQEIKKFAELPILAATLKRMGADGKSIWVRTGDSRKKMRFWCIPSAKVMNQTDVVDSE